jgi:hypothetical protein
MLDEPRAGRLASWGNALLAGEVSPDEAAERITGDDAVHRVTGLPGPADAPGTDAPVGLTLALGLLRARGAVGLRVALPAPGHPLGLAGPPEFNGRALDAGEAVVVSGVALGLVPRVLVAGPPRGGVPGADAHAEVVWECLPVREAPPADVPSLGEAERELAGAVREATEALVRLDVAGAGPAADAALAAYRARAEAGRGLPAPGCPPRAVRVLELAQRVGALVAIARGGEEHGAAVSAAEMAARDALLRPLERTARRAQVAAYNAFAEALEQRG